MPIEEALLIILLNKKERNIPAELYADIHQNGRYLNYLLSAQTDSVAWRKPLEIDFAQVSDRNPVAFFYNDIAAQRSRSPIVAEQAGQLVAPPEAVNLYYIDPSSKDYAITHLVREANQIESSYSSMAGYVFNWARGEPDKKQKKVDYIRNIIIPKIKEDQGITKEDLRVLREPTGLKGMISNKTKSAAIMDKALSYTIYKPAM